MKNTTLFLARILALALMAALSFCAAGCADSDEGGGGGGGTGPHTYPLSVRFAPRFFAGGNGWVVVHTLNGDSAISAVRVPQEGLVDLGPQTSSRVTFTVIADIPPSPYFPSEVGHVYLSTYSDVPSGEFIEDDPYQLDPIGWADVTVTFPYGQYSVGLVLATGTGVSKLRIPSEYMHAELPVYQLEDDGSLGLYALVCDSVGQGYCGWLLNQPFVPGDTNFYSFHLDRSLQHQIVTSSCPLGGVYLIGYRGMSYREYLAGFAVSENGEVGSTDFSLPFGNLPVTRWGLWGFTDSPTGDFRSVQRLASTVPSSLNLQDLSFEAEYGYQHDRLTNIIVNGPADLFMYDWDRWRSDSTGGSEVIWEVWADPQCQSLGLPVLPDSVLADIGLHMADLSPGYGLLWNFEPGQGFDEIVHKIYQSDSAWAAMFTDFSAYSTLGGGRIFGPDITPGGSAFAIGSPMTRRYQHHRMR